MTDRERIAIDKIIEIQRSHVNANIWAEENAVQIMDALKQLGYINPNDYDLIVKNLDSPDAVKVLKELGYTRKELEANK